MDFKKKKKKKKKKYYKITELVISEENKELAIDAISLVTDPAIEEDFVYFNKAKNNLTLAKIDDEQQMLVSPALIPNKSIYRYDAAKDQDFYVFFSKETVKQAAENYLRHNNHHKATYQHQERVSGVLTVESWIKVDEKHDKSLAYGYDLPLGTWFVTMKITNKDMLEKIRSGELRGLSIEGFFVDKMMAMSEERQLCEEEFLNGLADILNIK